MVAFLILFFASLIQARMGGPDDYGYVFYDQESGVAFEWIDESGADTLPLFGDDALMELPLPFPFRFYGNEYETVYVSTNGLVAVDPYGASSYRWENIPSATSPNGFLAPYWADGFFRYGLSAVLYKTLGTPPSRKFVIIFYKQIVPYYASGDFPFIYEVIIEETEIGDNPIVFQYLNVYEPAYWEYSFGYQAVIGIESPDGMTGLEYSYDTMAVDSGSAIRFEVVPLPEHDIVVTGFSIPSLIFLNTPFSVSVGVRNRTHSFERDILVVLDITDSTSVTLYHGEQTISLAAFDSTRVEFSGIRISREGTIFIRAEARIEFDEFPGNNVFYGVGSVYNHISRGGPDEAGYYWIDSFDPEGPIYAPISIEGATLVLSGDDESCPVSLPFPFTFYGVVYDSLYISTNGFISFLPISQSFYTNTIIPSTDAPNAIIAPFWDDMNLNRSLDSLSGVYTKYVPADSSFHIIWHNAYLPWNSTTDKVTFKLVLYRSGSILFNYENTETPATPTSTMGASATCGIENETGTFGLLYEYNGEPAPNPLFPRFAIYFSRMAGVVDTFPPTIAHIPPSRVDITRPNIILTASIYDFSGISADSLYYSVSGPFRGVTHDSISGSIYFYSIPTPTAGARILYYFVAYDGSDRRNRAVFPANDTLVLYTFDPHYGNPDSAGYRFVDSFSDSAEAPTFSWIELDPLLGGYGVVVPIEGDDIISEPIYIGGRFKFYGTWFDSVKVCTNGWLTFFTDEDTAWYRVSIPDVARPNGTIVAWGMDLIVTPSSRVFYYSDPINRIFVVEWKDVVAYSLRDSAITFEVIIDYGRSGSYIKVQYLRIENTTPLGLIGIENLTGTDGVVYYAFGEPSGVGIPSDSLAVLFYNPYVGIDEKEALPLTFSFEGPYPNPFNLSCTFELAIPDDCELFLNVYNCVGQNVRTIYSGYIKKGYHKIIWDGKSNENRFLPSGVYFVVAEHNSAKVVRRALLLK